MNKPHLPRKINPPRNLTPEEQAILERMLSSEFIGVQSLRKQLASVRVDEECSDCPLVGLLTDRREYLKAEVKYRVPVEAIGIDVDGGRIHILLHVVDGLIDELDIFREDPLDIHKLPSPDSLELLIYD